MPVMTGSRFSYFFFTQAVLLPLLCGALLATGGCQEKPTPNWQKYGYPELGFRTQFPFPPENARKDPLPGLVDNRFINAPTEMGDGSLSVSCQTFQPEIASGWGDLETMLVKTQAAMVGEGKVFHERAITIDGHPGREYGVEFLYDGQKMVAFNRIYVVGPGCI